MSEESSHDDTHALSRIIEDSRRIVFFGGAGVSTESGIPDFRSAAGLYQAEREYGYRPETILSAEFFAARTETFFDYYFGNLVHPDAQPGPAHRALAALENCGQLASVVTQNIDGLHGLAGSRNVLELHGSGQRNHCLQCGRRFGLEAVMALAGVFPGRLAGAKVPRCACGGIVRPDVVLYGEPLPDGVTEGAIREIGAADTLIIGGTSLAVYPAAGLIRYFQGDSLVLINLTPTSADASADLVIHRPIGETLAPFMR